MPSHLNEDDIANQGRELIYQYILDGILREHRNRIENIPTAEELREPGIPTGPALTNFEQTANIIRFMGDELDGDDRINRLVEEIPLDAPRETFFRIARGVFADNVFNWGRVVVLFLFAYKMALKSLGRIPLLKNIIGWVIEFIRETMARWIIERGGWDGIIRDMGTPTRYFIVVLLSGVAISAAVVLFRGRGS